jgi:hypothetical protein
MTEMAECAAAKDGCQFSEWNHSLKRTESPPIAITDIRAPPNPGGSAEAAARIGSGERVSYSSPPICCIDSQVQISGTTQNALLVHHDFA